MAKYVWLSDPVPEEMEIRQVYGIIFDRKGRIMLQVDHHKNGCPFSLPGGRPEPSDLGIEDTCRRELLEEMNTMIEPPVYIGFQRVDEENGTPEYAQVRLAAIIRFLGKPKPDPDNGRIYLRLWVSPEKAVQLLDWGDVGKKQIMQAKEMIYKRYSISGAEDCEEWV